MNINPENIFFLGSILLFISIIAGKASSRIGIPVLLLFLLIGMLAGSDGMGLIFSNPGSAQTIGNAALVIILFSGGMDTRFNEIRQIIGIGTVLSTIGVFLTALFTGSFIWLLFQGGSLSSIFGFKESLLLAAIMSSTDSASVFGILRSKGINIQSKIKSLLEYESGSNDPMAYMMTLVLITVITSGVEVSGWQILLILLMQLAIGFVSGILLGYSIIFIVNRINLDNNSLYSVLLIACAFFIYSFTNIIQGNGFLAVYVAALIIGNHKIVHQRSTSSFIDALAWLFQIIMFLTLGLLVNPSDLLKIADAALLTGMFLIIIGRPLTVFICTAFYKGISIKGKLFVSWVGLRGAVPIIFATYPLTAQLPQADIIFNIVFFITLLSLLVQGTTISYASTLLKQKGDTNGARTKINVEFPDEMKSAMHEIEITPKILSHGNMLMYLPLPEKTLAVLVKRDEHYFIPKGKTVLKKGDRLVVISEDEKEIHQMIRQLGIEEDK